jgi:hypothetical protein
MASPARGAGGRRSRREIRDASRRRSTYALGGVLVAVVAAMVWLFTDAKQSNPALASETLCPVSGPTAVTAVVVDATDPASKVTQAAIRARVLAAAEALPRFGRMEVYAAGADEAQLLRPLFAKCNPGRSTDVSQLNASPERVQRIYDEQFDRPLRAALQGVLDVPPSASSPILEGVQAVTVSAFPPKVEELPRRLILISDLIQNSPAYSMYGGPLDERAADTAGEAIPAQLEGVDVQLLMIRRAAQDTLQTSPEFVDFWEGWFSAAGARVSRAGPLPGRNQ